MTVHCLKPRPYGSLGLSWCGLFAVDAVVVEPAQWDFLPPSAACGNCQRSIGKPDWHRPEHSIAVEVALVGMARAVASWPAEART
ncbi:MAG: hypothetical protein H0T89_31265 [Deltaproteobacteria bacterium]|nr:hypothetical protein [Deltaproteobacteria bacterium]